jgi:uncharacterized tellurite resistance protein B-like protein
MAELLTPTFPLILALAAALFFVLKGRSKKPQPSPVVSNPRRVENLAVSLAFAVAAADGKLFAREIDVIKRWAKNRITQHVSNQPADHLEKALDGTLAFFRNAGQLDVQKLCKEIMANASAAQRYEIIELCLYVVQAKGFAAPEELVFVKNIACLLEIDRESFRAMTEKIVPVTMHKAADIETLLGLSADMTEEKTRRHLSKEYAKWSSRVTSFNPAVRAQAELMLKLIAETRNQYVMTASECEPVFDSSEKPALSANRQLTCLSNHLVS